jgi:hypothetical protein
MGRPKGESPAVTPIYETGVSIAAPPASSSITDNGIVAFPF